MVGPSGGLDSQLARPASRLLGGIDGQLHSLWHHRVPEIEHPPLPYPPFSWLGLAGTDGGERRRCMEPLPKFAQRGSGIRLYRLNGGETSS
jgi:hypothetical protein